MQGCLLEESYQSGWLFPPLRIGHGSGSVPEYVLYFYTYCPTSFSQQECEMCSVNYVHLTDVTTEAKKDDRSCSNSRSQQVAEADSNQGGLISKLAGLLGNCFSCFAG